MSESHVTVTNCPVCNHDEATTVDTRIKDRGAMTTLAIRECESCGTLWGEPREFFGVMDDAE